MNKRDFLKLIAGGSAGICFPSLSVGTTNLQLEINKYIGRQRVLGRISRIERTAWSVYDFKTGKKIVAINENAQLQSASMIKVFVALAYLYRHKVNPNRYPYNASVRLLMENMLVRSSNMATNTMIKKCGGPANVKRLCQLSTKGKFQALKIVEYIPQGGRTYRNKASAHDYSRYLYGIWNNLFIGSTEIKRIMSIKNIDRIRTKTTLPSYINIYDKTGSTGRLCGDMGIVELSKKDNLAYTFIGIIERRYGAKNYATWITKRSETMRGVSQIVYNYMQKRYLQLGMS